MKTLVRMDGAEARKECIAQIAKIIQAALYQSKETGWIRLSQAVSKIMIDTGLTRNKVMEYLQLLSATGQFELDENNDKIKRSRVCVFGGKVLSKPKPKPKPKKKLKT